MYTVLLHIYHQVKEQPFFQELLQRLESKEAVSLLASTGSFKRFLIALLFCHFHRVIVFVESPLLRVYRAELSFWLGERLLSTGVAPEVWLAHGGVYLASEDFSLPDLHWFEQHKLMLKKGLRLTAEELSKKLVEMGFTQDETEDAHFIRRGENILLFHKGERIHFNIPYDRLDSITIWGDQPAKLKSYTLSPQMEAVPLKPARLQEEALFVAEGSDLAPHGIVFSRHVRNPELLPLPDPVKIYNSPFPHNVRKALSECSSAQVMLWATRKEKELLANKQDVPVVPVYKFVPKAKAIYLASGGVQNAFKWAGLITLFTDRELSASTVSKIKAFEQGLSRQDIEALKPGDYLVHIEHGIGRFQGMVQKNGKSYFDLEYADGDRLYVPEEMKKRLHIYISSSGKPPVLTRLGHGFWERAKERVHQETKQVALKILKIAAKRKSAAGYAFDIDGEWLEELERGFPFEETEDQKRVLRQIKEDMKKPYPMDRILLGDVGFGKTELALRAALIATMNGKQVAVLCPTTVLAHQHFQTFSRRLKSFPLQVALFSRFVSAGERRKIREKLKDHQIDIVIGTHALLNQKLEFSDLGLFIIDEEQRFGVLHKEAVRERFPCADVLTLTATPIPRTLYMALTGLKDVSELHMPLPYRLPVHTQTIEMEKNAVQEAVTVELERGGSVFFVVPQIAQMDIIWPKLREWFPDVRIDKAHGQMKPSQIEQAMIRFVERKTSILLCTDIIENGLDIPTANTMFIYDAHRFGMAQLYQLRGRVGRSYYQAYCYLVLPKALDPGAAERILALLRYQKLDSARELSMKDLELRGSGNILGKQQSGFVDSVGLTLYLEILKENIEALKKFESLTAQDLPIQ